MSDRVPFLVLFLGVMIVIMIAGASASIDISHRLDRFRCPPAQVQR